MRIPLQTQPITRANRTDHIGDWGADPQLFGGIWKKIKKGASSIWKKAKCPACRAACLAIPTPVGKLACQVACNKTVC